MSRYKAYPAYKNSGVEWLANIPCDWDCVRLKFTSELSGKKVAPSNEERYVGLENVQSNSGKFITTEEVTPEGVSNVFSSGDVLFGKLRPYLAKSWLADFSGICSSEFLVMTSRKVDSKFLHYFTLTEEFIKQVDSSTYGSKMPRASWDFIGLLNIPIPSYESEKIASFLDHETAKIDALIEKQQRLIELLKEKRQAVISHAVTKGLNPNAPMKDSGVEWLGEVPTHWDIWKLAHAFSEIGSGTTPRSDNFSFYENGEIPWLNTGDLNDGELDECEKKISNFALKEHSTLKLFPANSLAIAMYGATIAKVALLRFATTVNQACCVFGDSNIVSIKFLFYWIMGFRAQIISLGTGGGQPNISQEILRNLRLACPNLAEQTDITNYLDIQASKFAELIKNAELFIQLLRERRTALISAAVTGKIDVRDWQAAA